MMERTMPSRRSTVLLIALLSSLETLQGSACSSSDDTPGVQHGDASARAAQAEPVVAPKQLPDAAHEQLEKDARALLAAWEAAQDSGDFAAYEHLYASRFTGVKRSGPRTRNFERKGWLKDREHMFKKPMQVDFTLQSLSVQDAAVTVLGTQSFSTAGYADRGQKAFTLAHDGGALRIVREEMLASDLGPAPTISARMVVDVPEGPVLVILGRASEATPGGERVSVHATFPSVLVRTAQVASAPSDANAFLAGDVQLVGPDGVCTTRGRALRIAHVGYAHFGQVAVWRGEAPELPKPSEQELAQQIHDLNPAGFWAVELESRCVKDPLVAVPGKGPITVYTRGEVSKETHDLVLKRFAKLPFVRALPREEREVALGELIPNGFNSGSHQLVSAESASGCSAPVLHALFDMEHGGKLGFAGDQGGLEHVKAVADLDGDGQPELIMRTAIGADTWGIVDPAGTPKLMVSFPYYDCPC